MSSYTYSKLPSASSTTRMVRLLPHSQTNAPIKCELINYTLFDTGGRRHLYEALSYVWNIDAGSSVSKSQSILLNDCPFPVTKNLHAALFYLRDHQLERTLWIDAICINQYDKDEKSQQIPLMRAIYAQASCVIVWLGEAIEDGSKALESIRCLAEDKALKLSLSSVQDLDINYDACLRLLQRNWFRRIWVLQEVGVARYISVMCGPVQISGHAFCEGLGRLELSSSLLRLVQPVTQLISGAVFRQEYKLGSKGSFFMGELIDMYHSHQASKSHDKVYALLGLSSDDPSTGALKPNYELPWSEVFRQTTEYIFSGESSVVTWPGRESALIKGKALVLGYIDSAPEGFADYGRQSVAIIFSNTAQSLGYPQRPETEWILQTSAMSIEKGDIICHLQGASKPSILRLCGDHFIIVRAMVTPQQTREEEDLDLKSLQEKHSKEIPVHDILLTWDISLGNTEPKHESQSPTQLNSKVPEYREEPQERKSRLHDSMAPIMEDIVEGILKAGGPKHQQIEDLLNRRGAEIPITEGLIKAVAGNTGAYGYEVMQLLFHHEGGALPISEEVVKAAAGNTGYRKYKIMELLLQHQGDTLPISEEVVKTAAGNTGCGYEMMELLFQHQGNTLPISKEAVKAAAGNTGTFPYGHEIMQLLFHHQGDSLPIDEQVVKAAAGNVKHGYRIIELLFQHQGKALSISQEVVKAAAGNTGYKGYEIIELLLQHQEDTLPISEEVVKAAAGNVENGYRIIELLRPFQHQGNALPISEEVVKTAAGNTGSLEYKIMELLLQHQGDALPVSEEVIKAAAGNTGCGYEMMELLFRHQGNALPISHEVVKAAAGNNGYREYKIMELLLQCQGDALPVSEEAVKAAAGNDGFYADKIRNMLSQVPQH